MAENGSRPIIDFDHHTAEYREGWMELYADLRQRCPIGYSERYGGFWLPTTYEDVCRVAKDDATFASDFDPDGVRNGYQGTNIPRMSNHRVFPMEADPPEYLIYRRLLNPFFAPNVADDLEPFVVELTNAFLDRVIERGEMDFVLDFANPVPAITLMRFLGLPIDDWEPYATPMHEIVYGEPGSEVQLRAQQGFGWVAQQMHQAVIDRRADPGDDLISRLATTEVEGELMTPELISEMLILIIGGGTDTATNLFANSILWLEDKPDVRQKLAGDPAYLTRACEEFLRYFTPLQTNARTVTTDTELGGQTLAARDRLLVSWAAANHDPAEFANADSMVLDRFPNRHVAFGVGIHRCLGSHIARMEIKVMLREVCRRLTEYRIDREAAQQYPTVGFINGWVNLPVTFTPGPRVGTSLPFAVEDPIAVEDNG
jgi:cytochrome P450